MVFRSNGGCKALGLGLGLYYLMLMSLARMLLQGSEICSDCYAVSVLAFVPLVLSNKVAAYEMSMSHRRLALAAKQFLNVQGSKF